MWKFHEIHDFLPWFRWTGVSKIWTGEGIIITMVYAIQITTLPSEMDVEVKVNAETTIVRAYIFSIFNVHLRDLESINQQT